ncbi:hypothetical protein R3P38DRAFT_2614458 [Favolaschia claudopus]|uniref:Uncharacterized protein n=1 Tax=Favolaschia claudopus TaxID=2862362 RepID=A0AAW0CN66_9AGAR
MYFASIAVTLALSVSGVVYGAPTMKRDSTSTIAPKACTGLNGTGTCVDLNFSPTDSNGVRKDKNRAECTNVSDPKSMVLDEADVCNTFPFADCDFINGDDVRVVSEFFISTQGDLTSAGPIKSISCTRVDGLVDGLFPQ